MSWFTEDKSMSTSTGWPPELASAGNSGVLVTSILMQRMRLKRRRLLARELKWTVFEAHSPAG